jgi:UDP-N-acetylmuramyl tripeptide synthase
LQIRFLITLLIAKATAFLLRLLRRGGTQLPGRIALKLCPDFLARIGKPPLVIAVTGTNGKTTVVNIIVDIYEHLGFRVASNRQGSNLKAGVASTLLTRASPGGKACDQIAVLEIDERSSRLIYPHLKVDFLVCTNLFRDSVGRNAHTEYIAWLIDSALPPGATLILNADDLISSSLGAVTSQGAVGQTPTTPKVASGAAEVATQEATANRRVFFGVAPLPDEPQRQGSLSRDITVCPRCDSPLSWEFVRYHHIGRASCPSCDFRSQQADYLALATDVEKNELQVLTPAPVRDGSEAARGTTFSTESPITLSLLNDSVFNIYNQMAALAVLCEAGLSLEQVTEAFLAIRLAETRYDVEEVGGVSLVMQLAKGQNAIACSRAFDYIAQQPGRKALVLNLDDFFDARGGSENITWLYDCDYEYLADPDIVQLVVGGVRSHDQYLRLLIAGVAEERLTRTSFEAETAELVRLEGLDAVYVLYDVYTVATAQAVRARLRERLQAHSDREDVPAAEDDARNVPPVAADDEGGVPR